MPAPLQVLSIRLRAALTLLIVCLVLGAIGSGYVYRRAMHRIDRRLAHSTLYAARPRLQAVAPRRIRTSPHLLPASTPVHPVRHLPAFDALPPDLVAAVVSIEDRRFFQHAGVDYGRTAECAVEDTLRFHAGCGGSTLTQQLARVYFLSPDKTLRRKVEEILIAQRLEQRLTKQQIFVMYTRAVSFGQNNGEAVKGFPQAAHVYFGRDLNQLDLAQDALLAGMVHAPNFDNPFRHPDRALQRRNVVLDSMVVTGAITRAEADAAKAEPLHLTASNDLPEEINPADDADLS